MPSVNVFVLSPETRSERKFDLSVTVGQLKIKLEPITGISTSSQVIKLYASETDTSPVAALDDDSKMLGYYSIRDLQVLKVEDKNPAAKSQIGQYTDVSQVEKYEMSDKEYESRRDTVLTYKQQHKMGRFAPHSSEQEAPSQASAEVNISLNSRCQVTFGGDTMKKRGTVRYVGPTKFGSGSGIWIGIEYDEPLGKNDGSVEGERYFTCKPSCGAFVRPENVTVGDFPPVDPFADEYEEM